MAKIYLIEGPVGAGKSTFAGKLSQALKAPHLNLDAWMRTLFSADRPASDRIPWYIERKQRCSEMIWTTAVEILNTDCDVILELGLIQRQNRDDFYQRVATSGYGLKVYLLDVPRDVRRERVRQRNLEQGETFSMHVPDNVFEMASDLWQAPDAREIAEQKIDTVTMHSVDERLSAHCNAAESPSRTPR